MAINTTLNTNFQDIWVCKKLENNSWGEPTIYNVSISPTNSDGEIFVYGVSFPQYLKIKSSKIIANDFSVGDRVYFKKNIPENHNEYQNTKNDANFEVVSIPSITINIGEIRLKYLVGR